MWGRAATVLLITAAAPAPSAVAPSLVFDGVTVVDVEQGKLISDQRVVITGNRIEAIGPADKLKLPNGAQVVDARGKYLIPGFWDMHVHPFHEATDVFYPLFIASRALRSIRPRCCMPPTRLVPWHRESWRT